MRLLALVVLLACGSKSREEPAPPKPAASDAAVLAVDAAPAPVDTPAAVDPPLPAAAVEVPTTAAALQTWLVAGHYKSWPHESKQHPSDGPHNDVRVFLSPSLASSLGAKTKSHPKGAAAVKELYKSGKHNGWAVSVKVEAESASGKGWYWYEVFSLEPAAKAPYQGVGVKLCRECHSDGGTDQVLIGYPLQ